MIGAWLVRTIVVGPRLRGDSARKRTLGARRRSFRPGGLRRDARRRRGGRPGSPRLCGRDSLAGRPGEGAGGDPVDVPDRRSAAAGRETAWLGGADGFREDRKAEFPVHGRSMASNRKELRT